MSGSCWCGGAADRCADAGQHTGPDAALANALEGRSTTGWTYGACACGRSFSVNAAGICGTCASEQRRSYFASPAAAALVASVMGTPTPTVAPVVELRPDVAPARRAA